MTKSRGILGPRRTWTAEEIEQLKLLYPDRPAREIAAQLDRPMHCVYKKAKDLGLSKSAAFYASDLASRIQHGKQNPASIATQFKKGHVPANKGLRRPGWARGRMAETQFKKGRPPQEARNYVPVGTEKIDRKRGALMRKMTDSQSIYPAGRWRPVHVLVWEAANGPVPAGYLCIFKPGMKTFIAAEITVDRLELVSYRENMRRNTIHNLPQPLPQLMQLRGALNRKINKRTRAREEQA